MGGFSGVLVYAIWGAAPLVAYQALVHGLARAWRGFALFFAVYSAAALLTLLALRGAAAPTGGYAPMAVLAPWAGTAALSALLYGLGARAGGAGR